ncbi:MAG: hypothetical protein KKC96_00560 [Nanoarchaeota archaeon]|nr:hypothetical protein [Nanoarchaeota archaeon]
MAEKKQPDYSSFERYQFGALAGVLAGSEESARHAPRALEILAGKDGLNLDPNAKEYHDSFGEQTPEQIEKAIKTYSGKFRKARGELSPVDLIGWYSDVLSCLDEGEMEKVVAYFGQYEEPLGAIESKMGKASHIKKGEGTGANTDEEVAAAEKMLQKYGTLMQVMSVLDNYKFENLRPNVVGMSKKEDLKGIAAQLPEVASYKARAA